MAAELRPEEAQRRLLLVAARDPWSARRGDQLRALQLARAFEPEWRVTLLAPTSGEAAGVRLGPAEVVPYRRTLLDRVLGVLRSALTGEPFQAGLYASRDLERQLATRARESELVLVQLVRSREALRVLLALSGAARRPIVVDFIDCLSLAFERRAAVDAWWRRSALRVESRRLASAERSTLASVAAAAVVCTRDRDAMLARATRSRPELAEKLAVLPLAIAPEPPAAPRPREERPSLALTGNLGYFVNRDAVRFFLGQVWPALRRARPEVRLLIAGARAAGLAAEASAAGAELVADPTDLRGLVASASVAVAPLRCGAGVPVKVLEAWAVGTPVVASSWAVAGTSAVPERDLLVADEPSEWLRQIGRLLDDDALRVRLAASGRALLEHDHGADETGAAIRSWANAAATDSRR